ncbi:Rrf2 family transcriptional regulator [Niallia nealsonii]|uniref:Rrf2 family transcriptional regulator n=1 Tax=Niallia nealsonii TaxID=115979 RepID=A0A2N0YYJ2_9BACI|nr:Rrf2 family transcriptional regulator [Niallia nealsonii]PKG22330.1 Rrf2 family transcriptional regulator [Niallia nealsonii]
MVNNRLAVGIHILSIVALSKDAEQVTSEMIAGSINTNPVVVRRMCGFLKKANLIKPKHKNRGLMLVKKPAEINLLEILRAVDPENELFSIHSGTNSACDVGRNIESALKTVFEEVQEESERALASKTLQQVIGQFR